MINTVVGIGCALTRISAELPADEGIALSHKGIIRQSNNLIGVDEYELRVLVRTVGIEVECVLVSLPLRINRNVTRATREYFGYRRGKGYIRVPAKERISYSCVIKERYRDRSTLC